jgi:hypothetical protein
MPLGKFQEGLRLCESVSLGPAQINPFLANPARYPDTDLCAFNAVLNQLAQVVRASYEDAPCAASFLSLATAEAVFS